MLQYNRKYEMITLSTKTFTVASKCKVFLNKSGFESTAPRKQNLRICGFFMRGNKIAFFAATKYTFNPHYTLI